jgi:hypothetical protein
MTPKYRPGSAASGGGLMGVDSVLDASALDLIRQLDCSLAEANQSIVESSREAESATHNARLAAEIRRRFSRPGDQHSGSSNTKNKHQQHYGSSPSSFSSLNTTAPEDHTTTLFQQHYEQQQHPYRLHHNLYHHSSAAPSPSSSTNAQQHRQQSPQQHNNSSSNPHSRLAVAHVEELVDLSSQLEHVRSQLEQEMVHHQESKAKLSCAETIMTKLHDHIAQLQDQMESMRESHDQVVLEQQQELTVAQSVAQQESEDALFAMEMAKQKIAEEQEMRTLLQQVLEKNEEYRRFIAEQQYSSLSGSKKAVSFRDPVDDLSHQNHRALVAMGRELLHQQLSAAASSPDVAAPSPAKQAAQALTTCQATAVILKESGHKLGCWEEKETSISDEVQLERLARQYTSNVELQLTQQRQSIQELESFCALLEQQQQQQ